MSNLVLEAEISKIQSQLPRIKETDDKAMELKDRLQSLELRKQLLVVQVETGMLTLPAYINNVRGAIKSLKMLAIKFKRAGKLQEAKEALTRIKIMESEVREVEESGLLEEE